MALDNLEVLHQGKIPLADAGIEQHATRGVSVAVYQFRVRGVEGGNVPEAGNAAVGRNRADPRCIRIGTEASVGGIADRGRGARRPLRERNDAAKLPAAEDLVRYAAPIGQGLASSDRQVIKDGSDKALADMMGSQAAVRAEVIRIDGRGRFAIGRAQGAAVIDGL